MKKAKQLMATSTGWSESSRYLAPSDKLQLIDNIIYRECNVCGVHAMSIVIKNLKPYTLNPKLSPKPYTLNPKP